MAEESSPPAQPAPENGAPGHSDQSNKPKGKPWYQRPLIAGSVFLVIIVVVITVILFWINSRKFESTEDASIDVDSQQVSPRVEGRISRVLVNDNQEVSPGQVVAELDPADFQNTVLQAQATDAQAKSQVAQSLAQKAVFQAQVEQARANLAVTQANAENAQSQLSRYQSLRSDNSGAVSQEQLDNAIAAQKVSLAQVEAALRAISAAEAQIGYADSLTAAAQAGVNSANSRLEQANLNLGYTHLVAEIAGRVSRKQVAVGNNVQPGTPVMAIVPREIYITANFKETQLAKMRTGQAVKIHADAYPDLELSGHVDSFQSGTGQAFSEIPAENATGNWVKVVQRVPVKIVLDQIPNDPERRLGPGMSVEVKVRIEP